MMDKDYNNGGDTSKYLQKSVEDYAAFVCQVLYDEAFLVELNRTMPFDKMVHATKNMGMSRLGIKKMGISVMRMDIEPPLYSLAITLMFKGTDGLMQNHSIFINACKTIEELQQLTAEDDFKKEVLSLCEERVLGKQPVLTDK